MSVSSFAKPLSPLQIGLGILLICFAPFLFTPVLPFIDYYAHISRYYILAHIDNVPALEANYTAAWQLLPNLGVDIMGATLMQFLPPLIVAKLLAGLIIVTLFSGITLLGRIVQGRFSPLTMFLAGLAVYNNILIWGFANFLLGMGIGLHGLALWIALADRPLMRWALTLPLGVALFFVHGLAFAIWGLLLGAVELEIALRHTKVRPLSLLKRALVLLTIAVPPALLFTQMQTSGAEGGVTMAFDNLRQHAVQGRFGAEVWDEIAQRADNMLRVLDTDHPMVDRLFGALIWAGLIFGLATRRLHLARPLRTAVLLAIVLLLVTPPNMFGVGYLDDRMPLLLFLLLAAGVAPADPARQTPLVAPVAIAFVAHIGLVCLGWHANGQVYTAFIDEISQRNTGETARLVYFEGTEARDPISKRCQPLPSLLLLKNGTAVSTFANPTQQPLRLDGALRAAEASASTQLAALSTPPSQGALLSILSDAGYDTLITCHAQAPSENRPAKAARPTQPWSLVAAHGS